MEAKSNVANPSLCIFLSYFLLVGLPDLRALPRDFLHKDRLQINLFSSFMCVSEMFRASPQKGWRNNPGVKMHACICLQLNCNNWNHIYRLFFFFFKAVDVSPLVSPVLHHAADFSPFICVLFDWTFSSMNKEIQLFLIPVQLGITEVCTSHGSHRSLTPPICPRYLA